MEFVKFSHGMCDDNIEDGREFNLGPLFLECSNAVDNGEECMMISALAAPPLLLFTIPLTLVDMSSALIIDTVMLPADLVITPSDPKLHTPRPMVCRYDYKI